MREIRMYILTDNILSGLVSQGSYARRRRVVKQRRHCQVETVSVRFTKGRSAAGNHP